MECSAILVCQSSALGRLPPALHLLTGWGSPHLLHMWANRQSLPYLQSPLNLFCFWQISWLGLCRLPGAVPDNPHFLGAFAGQVAEVWSSDWHVLHQFSTFMFWPKTQSEGSTLAHDCPFSPAISCRKA